MTKLVYGHREELITVGNYKYQVEFFISKLIPGKEPKLELKEQLYRENTKAKSYYPQIINSLDKVLSGENKTKAYEKLEELKKDYYKTLEVFINKTDYEGLKQIGDVIKLLHPDLGIIRVAEAISRVFRTRGQSLKAGVLVEFTKSALGRGRFDHQSIAVGDDTRLEILNWENSFYGEQ